MVKRTVLLQDGQEHEIEVVGIKKLANDEPIIIELEDGSTLRLKVDIIEIGRSNNAWDLDGYPLYHVRSGNIMAVLDCPPNLRKPSTPK